MPVTLMLQQIPSGSQLVETISGDEPDDLNDFSVLILLDANGTGLTESDITFSTGASLVSLTGSKSVWQATIRPPETEGMLTITVGANAFTEGNAETSQDIRVSTSFPDDDAEEPTFLFDHNLSRTGVGVFTNGSGITVSPTRILINSGGQLTLFSAENYIDFFTYSGIHQTSETVTYNLPGRRWSLKIDYVNGDILYQYRGAMESPCI